MESQTPKTSVFGKVLAIFNLVASLSGILTNYQLLFGEAPIQNDYIDGLTVYDNYAGLLLGFLMLISSVLILMRRKLGVNILLYYVILIAGLTISQIIRLEYGTTRLIGTSISFSLILLILFYFQSLVKKGTINR
ncbi:MAG: hypothetical protein ACPGU4_06330 [Flavobacteriales bacterium]